MGRWSSLILISLGLVAGAAQPESLQRRPVQKGSVLKGATYTNPVVDRDLPDPGVLVDGGRYWMTHTMGGPDVGWPLYESRDLRNWTFRRHLLERANKPAWMKDAFWAPEIHRIARGKYVLTFTAGSNLNGKLCIGMATATKVDGPYAVQEKPIVAGDITVLDSHILRDDRGALFLYWKRDGNKRGVNGTLVAQRLDASGARLLPGSKPTTVLTGDEGTTAPEAKWERGLVEAPWIVRREGWYYLFYSGAFIDTTYSLGVARSRSPLGPFVRNPANPILKSNGIWGGPGHGAFVKDAAGSDFHYYHARRQAEPGAGRVQLLDRVTWRGGWPTFPNGGTPTTTPQPAPR